MHTDPAQVHLLLDGELLETTPEHPFYTLERGWVDAGDLWVGAHIRKADGSYGRVQFLAVERESQVMYNLTVDEAHTFFVGAQRWLVHNSGCDEVFLYHGSRDGIVGGKFDLEQTVLNRRPDHYTSEDSAVFLTDDLARAATQYATPHGEVARVRVPKHIAEQVKQQDIHGNVEYKFTQTELIDLLNSSLEILPQREAILRWWRK